LKSSKVELVSLAATTVNKERSNDVKVDIREAEGGVKIVDCAGKLILDKGTATLRQTVLELYYQGQTKILLNLEAVAHIDGAGLGELVSCLVTARHIGSELKLMKLSNRLIKLMEKTQLLPLFGGNYSDEKEALASFLAQPETACPNC
jgi:anti-anti-sigma factor